MKNLVKLFGIALIIVGPLIFLLGIGYTLLLPNIYLASARISVSEINPFTDQQNLHPACNPYFLRKQLEILQSEPILNEVISRLNLQDEWSQNGEKLPRNVAYKILKSRISIFQQRDTSLLVISVKCNAPDEAARIANELAQTYRDSRLELVDTEIHAKIDQVKKILQEQKMRVNKAKKVVEQLRTKLNIHTDPAERDNILLQYLESSRLNAQMEMEKKGARLKILADLKGKTLLDRASYVPFDQFIVNYSQQLRDVENRLDSMETDFGANHPEVQSCLHKKKALEKTLEQRFVTLKNGLETEYKLAETELNSLDKKLKELHLNSEKYHPYRKANSELQAEQFIYEQLSRKLQKETITIKIPQNTVEIIDEAKPNMRPVSPNLFLNVMLSFILAALVSGTGLALLLAGNLQKRNLPKAR